MRTRDADILIIPGLGGSGPEHWQTRWESKLSTARRVEQPDWHHPDLAVWTANIADAVAGGQKPVVFVAHSLGVIATVHVLLRTQPGRIAGAFLVAPPAEACVATIPEISADFRPYPMRSLPCPTTFAASTSDPYCDFEAAEAMVTAWGATLQNAGDAGHINIDSGHGPWPEGLMSFAGFLSKL